MHGIDDSIAQIQIKHGGGVAFALLTDPNQKVSTRLPVTNRCAQELLQHTSPILLMQHCGDLSDGASTSPCQMQ